jgi:hypothetical protein
MIATGLQCRQHGLDVVFHEQHAGDDDVALGDVRRQRCRAQFADRDRSGAESAAASPPS